MSLYAISDLHLANKANQKALIDLQDYGNSWITLAGDIGENEKHLELALLVLTEKFDKIIWTPGNHDLWTFPLKKHSLKGVEKYKKLVSICHKYGVHTPEDDYQLYRDNDKKYYIAPIMTLYDYSFKPDNVTKGNEIEWAAESGVICADENLLFSNPYNSIQEWCEKRCRYTENKLNAIANEIPIIAVNHYPLLERLGKIYAYPCFSIWCGTKITEKWLDKFNIEIVIYGHLHIRSSKKINGIRHEEVSFGYPNDWDENKGLDFYLRKII